MPTLTTYTKTTEANILANPPTADGEMAFSTDTKKLFISEGTDWVYWTADKTLGKYYLGADQVARPRNHFDPTVSASMAGSSGLAVSNGGSVATIKDLAGGEKLEADTALQQPTLVSASGTTPFALPSGDARINGLPVWRFDGSQYLYPSIEMKRQSIYTTGVTVMIVHRQVPQVKTADGSTDSTYYIPSGDPRYKAYSALLGFWGGPSMSTRNDTNVSKSWRNAFNAAFSPNYLNRFDGDQGECSLSVFRVSANPFASKINFEQRHVTSLGTQLSLGTGTYAGSSTGDIVRLGSSTTGKINLGGIMLGTNPQFSGYPYRGEVGEILVWTESLSQDDYNTAGEYLAGKWGFTW